MRQVRGREPQVGGIEEGRALRRFRVAAERIDVGGEVAVGTVVLDQGDPRAGGLAGGRPARAGAGQLETREEGRPVGLHRGRVRAVALVHGLDVGGIRALDEIGGG